MFYSKANCILLITIGLVTLVNSANHGRQRFSSSSYSQKAVDDEPEETLEHEAKASEVAPVRHPSSSYSRQTSDEYSRTPPVSYGSSMKSMDEDYAEEQAKSAKYAFASAVDDGIMDQSQVRQEVRDGLKVKGSYSYSDGFYKRTIKYEADEGGYRVVGEETEPIGAGPQVDLLNGKADVHTQVDGFNTQYSISADEINTMGGRDTKPAAAKSN